MRICTFNAKGGVGKSTIAISVAAELHRRGRQVLLADADDQRTALSWAAVAASEGHDVPTTIGLHAGFHRPGQIPSGYDDVVIDLPGRSADVCRAGLLVSDLAVVPVLAGAVETWALSRALQTLGEARALRPNLRILLVLNRDNPRTGMSKNTRQALASCGVPLAKTALVHRISYVEALSAGQGPTTYQPDSPAATEVRELVDELLENTADAEQAA